MTTELPNMEIEFDFADSDTDLSDNLTAVVRSLVATITEPVQEDSHPMVFKFKVKIRKKGGKIVIVVRGIEEVDNPG